MTLSCRFSDTTKLGYLLGMGTAVPERMIEQKNFTADFLDTLTDSKRVKDIARKINKSCGITTRHLAYYKDEYAKNPSLTKFGAPTLDDRLTMFENVGVAIGHEAAEKAIADWGGDKSDITHIFTYSSSGMLCPGLDLRLIKSLGLRQQTKHVFVSYMGCHAGLVGLRSAYETALADPSHRVLVVCSEVNSANGQALDPEHPVNNIIVNIIFGDGAGAMVVGCNPTKAEAPIFEIHRTSSTFIPGSDEDITARISCRGLVAGLTKDVPSLVSGAVDPFVRSLVGEGVDYEKDLLWAVHPGGKAIVDATEKGCNLSPGKLQVSRDILDRYSNMSSSTILFVLDKVRKDNEGALGNPWTLALGFGPGITVDGILMRLVS